MVFFIVYFAVWCITALAAIFLFILHPRFHYLLMLLYSLYKCLKGIRMLKSHRKMLANHMAEEGEEIHFSAVREIGKTFKHLIYMLAIVFFIGGSQIGWWWHAPYEYKADIRQIKSTDDRFAYFPDELPCSAKNIHWICRPGMMQGSSAKMLYFYADSDYVRTICDRFQDTAMIYTYVKEDWMDVGSFMTIDGHEISYRYLINSLSEEHLEHSVIYGTYLTQDNHGRCGGILVDPVDNFVYYFFD